jgi:AcrR family transcriptional regulator
LSLPVPEIDVSAKAKAKAPLTLPALLSDLHVEPLSLSSTAVKMRMRINGGGAAPVPAILLSALSDLAARTGASEKLAYNPTSLALLSSSTLYFPVGSGPWLLITGSSLDERPNESSWQISVSRSAKLDDQNGEIVSQSLFIFRTEAHSPLPAAPTVAETAADVAQLETDADEPATGDEGDSVPDQRRRQIFLGACKVVAEKGYATTTIRDIAKACKLKISTMYQYITSKEDILFMITKGCMAELFADFELNLRDTGSATEKVKNAIDNHVNYISKNRKYINLVYRETKSLNAENRAKIFDLERRVVALWEKIINEGKRSGEFSVQDAELTAHFIYFLCNVWALRHWAIGDHTEKEIREMLYLFTFGALNKKPKRN